MINKKVWIDPEKEVNERIEKKMKQNRIRNFEKF